MLFPHIVFLLINLAVTAVVLMLDRRKIKDYIFLSIFGLAASFIFETVTTMAGFWYYYSEPKIFVISLYTWLLYVPYLIFCYFIGDRLGGKQARVKSNG